MVLPLTKNLTKKVGSYYVNGENTEPPAELAAHGSRETQRPKDAHNCVLGAWRGRGKAGGGVE